MTTIMFLKRFAEPIVAGTKRQTIRPPRKRPITVGENLSLRVWKDKAYRSPQETLMDTTCSAVFDVVIEAAGFRIGGAGPLQTDRDALDEFARADGFTDWQDFAGHFDGFYGFPFAGVVHQWDPPSR